MKVLYVRVPILTEEYRIHVLVGDRAAVIRAARRQCGASLLNFDDTCRGLTLSEFPTHDPVIAIAGELSLVQLIATLGHEASHAMRYIADHISLHDDVGEFEAHGVAAVMRAVVPKLLRRVR